MSAAQAARFVIAVDGPAASGKGTLARRLAASPAVKDLPRGAARSAEIVKMALQAAEDIHLPAGMQGKGLAR